MATDPIERSIEALTNEDPSYEELVEIYNSLCEASAGTAYERISQRALAQVVGEFVEYLDFVTSELEKSVGVTRPQERERVLGSFQAPSVDDPAERVAAVIEQWDAIERYSYEDVHRLGQRSHVEVERQRHRTVEFDQ